MKFLRIFYFNACLSASVFFFLNEAKMYQFWTVESYFFNISFDISYYQKVKAVIFFRNSVILKYFGKLSLAKSDKILAESRRKL